MWPFRGRNYSDEKSRTKVNVPESGLTIYWCAEHWPLLKKMKSKKYSELTPQEKYDIDYATGYRIGRISASRSTAIIILKNFGKPSRSLLHKINHEVDCRILLDIVCRLANKSLTVETLEDIYDSIIPPEDDVDEDTDWED